MSTSQTSPVSGSPIIDVRSTHAHVDSPPRTRTRRLSTETKAAYKTTEFFVFIAAVVGVLIASMAVGTNNHTGANGSIVGDYFRADKAWLLVTILSVGYMISRGFAKMGSRDFYDADDRDDA